MVYTNEYKTNMNIRKKKTSQSTYSMYTIPVSLVVGVTTEPFKLAETMELVTESGKCL